MSQGEGRLAQGDAITHFRVSIAKEERFAEFYTGEGADGRLHDASGQPGESFCRQIFSQTHARRGVDPSQAMPLNHITQSDDSGIVSFSGFRALPFHVQRWMGVDLVAPHDGEYAFRLGTCGGVRVWRSGEQLACFTPFTRNQMQYLPVRLALREGKNRLLIHLDELFERDTDCSLHMVYLDEPTLGIVPVTGSPLPANPVSPAPDGSRLLTLMAQREYGPEADALLYRLLKQVSAREEGSVFSLLTLLQLWKNARQADFPEPLWRRMKSTILGYRYWHDERGCDAMDFWGESAPVFHAAQMQAGALFPDERFIASSRFGHQQQRLGELRLKGVNA
ncbi:hypothetical protein [Enterobacter sp. CP102]|uniref:hypothetical protein n=1 Tax=Enterobacter sp. CP102 TaxID=2976431 RepID=UPI002205FD81|nr:hypothetical protein [Enterobacter sp. CP102]UWM64758.1 hypothetical protein N1249_02700 [Enterobacter sp. CP102]